MWFLSAFFVGVVRRCPIGNLDHLARGFRVEGFVGIGDRLSAEAEKKCEERKEKKGEDRGPHALALYVGRLWREAGAIIGSHEDGCGHRRIQRSAEVRQPSFPCVSRRRLQRDSDQSE